LPEVVASFDLSLGLRGGRVTQGDAVEAERFTQLGERFGNVSEEEGMVVHVERQGQAMDLEGAGQEIKVGQERFAGVEAGAGVIAGGVVQHVEEGLLVGVVGQPGVRAHVVLPERAQIASLPAFDGFGRGFVAGIGSQVVFNGPAADTGAVGFELVAAVQFAGGSAVRGRRFGGEELGQQCRNLCGPLGMMIAARNTGGPHLGQTLCAGPEVLTVEFIEAGTGQAQFAGGFGGGQFLRAVPGQQVTDEGSGQAFDQLRFFIAASMTEGGGFFALNWLRQGHAGPP